MKVILAILLFGLSLAFAQITDEQVAQFSFRVANHLGPDLPATISFKACGLPNVYVNAKNNSRFGFGQDIAAQANPDALGICPNGGCGGSSKRTIAFRDDDSDTDALYAADSVVNFNIFWHSTDSSPDQVLTRVSQGAVAYVMGPGSSLAISSIDGGNSYSTVTIPGTESSVAARNYPQAVFNFNDNNRMVKQNWYLESNNGAPTCTAGAANPNDLVSSYAISGVTNENIASLSFKSRVRFAFEPSSSNANGRINVFAVWNSSTQHLEVHTRGDEGASFSANWISDIDVRIAITGTGVNALIQDGVAPSSVWLQTCSAPADSNSVPLSYK